MFKLGYLAKARFKVVVGSEKLGSHSFSCQSPLLSTTVLNDIYEATLTRYKRLFTKRRCQNQVKDGKFLFYLL